MLKKPLSTDFEKVYECKTIEKYIENEDKTYSVSFGDAYEETFDAEEFYKYDLYEVGEMMKTTLKEFSDVVNAERCYFLGVSLLYGSLKPSGFISRTMKEANFSTEHIEQAFLRLYEGNYLNDTGYAEKFVQKRLDAKSSSLRMIKVELVNKGIPEEIAEEVLANFEIDDCETAKSIVEKRAQNGDSAEKTMRYLAGKGFGSSVIRKTIEEIYGRV